MDNILERIVRAQPETVLATGQRDNFLAHELHRIIRLDEEELASLISVLEKTNATLRSEIALKKAETEQVEALLQHDTLMTELAESRKCAAEPISKGVCPDGPTDIEEKENISIIDTTTEKFSVLESSFDSPGNPPPLSEASLRALQGFNFRD